MEFRIKTWVNKQKKCILVDLYQRVYNIDTGTNHFSLSTGMRVGSDEKNGNWCAAKKKELNLHYIGN